MAIAKQPADARQTIPNAGANDDDMATLDVKSDAISTDSGLDAELQALEQLLIAPISEEEAAYLAEPECEQIVQLAIATFENGRASQRNGQDNGVTPTVTLRIEPQLPFQRLGDYELMRKLGAGGMGTVYVARHTRLRREVALKLLPTDRLLDPAAVTRFDREMHAVGQLNHPNIVVAHDAGEVDGTHYLAMELVDGRDVGELTRELGPLSVADACEIVRQAALGLQHAHERGMVHRDIKPSNLILTRGGQVKILDMGLALLGEKHLTGGELTGSGQLMGTLDYMAPEQGTSSHQVDIRADVYSLGATLYRLLCGQAPFGGAGYDTPVRKLMALATENPQPVEQRRPDVPVELAALVDRMLARNPEHRPATPAEVATALAPFAASNDLIRLVGGAPGAAASPEHPATDPYLSASATDTTPSRAAHRTDIPARPIRPAGDVFPTKPAPSPASHRHRRAPILIATAAGLLALLALAIVVTLQTPQGTVSVEIADDYAEQVEISVRGGGREVVLSQQNGWQVKLADGQYTVSMSKGDDRFVVNQNTLTIRRGEQTKVTVTNRPAELAKSDVPQPTPSPAPPPAPKPPTPEPPLAKAEPPSTKADPPATAPPAASGPPRTPLPDGPPGIVKVIENIEERFGRTAPHALSPDGRTVAIPGYQRKKTYLLDLITEEVVGTLEHSRGPEQSRFSKNGQWLLSVNGSPFAQQPNQMLEGWNLSDPQGPQWQVPLKDVRDARIAAAPAGNIVAVAGVAIALAKGTSPGPIYVFDVQTGKELHVIDSKTKNRKGLAISPDERYLTFFAEADQEKDKAVCEVWDLTTGELHHHWTHNHGGPNHESVHFLPDSRHFTASFSTARALLFDITGKTNWIDAPPSGWRFGPLVPLHDGLSWVAALDTHPREPRRTMLQFRDRRMSSALYEVPFDRIDHGHPILVTPDHRFCVPLTDTRACLCIIRLPQQKDHRWQEQEDPERRVAAWVLDNAGEVRIRLGEREPQLHIWDDLPDEPFHVIGVYLTWNRSIASADLKNLAALSRLEVLNLAFASVEAAADLHFLTQVPTLRKLGIPENRNDANVYWLDRLTGLEDLYAIGQPLSNASLDRLAKLTKLKALDLAFTKITPAGLKRLSELPALESLRLNPELLTVEGCENLSSLPHLKKLAIKGAPSEESFNAMHELQQLETLILEVPSDDSAKDMRERLAKPLADLTEKLPHVRIAAFSDYRIRSAHNDHKVAEWTFRLGGTVQVGDEECIDAASARDVLDLPQGFQLKEISLRDCAQVNDTELRELAIMAGSPYLESIDMSGTPISDTSLDLLKTFTLLKTLDVRRTKLTATAIDQLRTALPRCQIEWEAQPQP